MIDEEAKETANNHHTFIEDSGIGASGLAPTGLAKRPLSSDGLSD